jgi:hypothetical protein
LEKVTIPENKNLCWMWTGYKKPNGYGTIRFERNNKFLAHRASYIFFNGDFPRHLCVCHTCDNPSCVNPKHLWVGTKADNHKDMDSKGRRKINSPNKKITNIQVIEIRGLHKIGVKYADLSRLFNMSGENIRRICLRITWKDI